MHKPNELRILTFMYVQQKDFIMKFDYYAQWKTSEEKVKKKSPSRKIDKQRNRQNRQTER
jgi:hypothetical protein